MESQLSAEMVSYLAVSWLIAQIGCASSDSCAFGYINCDDNCYYLSNMKATWQEAYFGCNNNLVILSDKKKDENLRNCLQNRTYEQVDRWIGGIYDWKQHRWNWGSTGQAVKYQAFSRRSPNENDTYKCIVTNANNYHRWSARYCHEKMYYICEAPIHNV